MRKLLVSAILLQPSLASITASIQQLPGKVVENGITFIHGVAQKVSPIAYGEVTDTVKTKCLARQENGNIVAIDANQLKKRGDEVCPSVITAYENAKKLDRVQATAQLKCLMKLFENLDKVCQETFKMITRDEDKVTETQLLPSEVVTFTKQLYGKHVTYGVQMFYQRKLADESTVTFVKNAEKMSDPFDHQLLFTALEVTGGLKTFLELAAYIVPKVSQLQGNDGNPPTNLANWIRAMSTQVHLSRAKLTKSLAIYGLVLHEIEKTPLQGNSGGSNSKTDEVKVFPWLPQNVINAFMTIGNTRALIDLNRKEGGCAALQESFEWFVEACVENYQQCFTDKNSKLVPTFAFTKVKEALGPALLQCSDIKIKYETNKEEIKVSPFQRLPMKFFKKYIPGKSEDQKEEVAAYSHPSGLIVVASGVTSSKVTKILLDQSDDTPLKSITVLFKNTKQSVSEKDVRGALSTLEEISGNSSDELLEALTAVESRMSKIKIGTVVWNKENKKKELEDERQRWKTRLTALLTKWLDTRLDKSVKVLAGENWSEYPLRTDAANYSETALRIIGDEYKPKFELIKLLDEIRKCKLRGVENAEDGVTKTCDAAKLQELISKLGEMNNSFAGELNTKITALVEKLQPKT